MGLFSSLAARYDEDRGSVSTGAAFADDIDRHCRIAGSALFGPRPAEQADNLFLMLDGVMLLWWILTIPSFLFVVIDIWRTTPESVVLKWAFVILTAFTGPLGAFFYVLGCREPLRGSHEQYVAARWRQVLGSTMHCVAGDGIGIIVGAAVVVVMRFAMSN